MDETINEFLRAFSGVVSVAKMYETKHPQFRNAVDTAYARLQEVFKEREELLLGIVEDEIVYGDRILFQLSEVLQMLIVLIKKKNIEKIVFFQRLTRDEFVQFLSFLVSSQEIETDPQEHLDELGIDGLEVSRMMSPEEQKEKEDITPYEQGLKHVAECLQKNSPDQFDPNFIFSKMRSTAKLIVSKLHQDYPGCLENEHVPAYGFQCCYILNTAILSVHVASKFGFSQEGMMSVGMAALLCPSITSGFTQASQEVLQTSLVDRFHEGQKKAKALVPFKEIFGIVPIVVAFQQGLPFQEDSIPGEMDFVQKPHCVSMIISLSEIYEYQRLTISGASDRTPAKICQDLQSKHRGWFDPRLLDRFISIVTA